MAKPEVAQQQQYACRQCTAPVSETSMIVGGAPREQAVEAGIVFCSTRCLSAFNGWLAYAQRCQWCDGAVDRASPVGVVQLGRAGRPRGYCSVACRRARERAYAASLRRLAARVLPSRSGDSVEAWAELAETAMSWARDQERLLARVQNRRADSAPGLGDDDAALPTIVDSHLISAIKAWLGQLWELHHEARAGEGRARLRAEDADALAVTLSLGTRAAQARAADDAWRQDLIAKTGPVATEGGS